MKYQECLVTGGAGFIGSHMVERLLLNGKNVTVIDNLVEGKVENLPKHDNLTFVRMSILDDLDGVMAGKDVVFHFAALPRVQRSIEFPRESHLTNVDGTFNLLMSAKKHGVQRFVFSSSSSVYGDQDKLPFVETMTPNPMSPYALHKLTGEQYCDLFWRTFGLSTISLRYFNVYGPRMYPDGAYANLLPKFIKLLKEDIAPTINGDGEQTRDFTNVCDVVEANVLAADSNYHGVVNIGSGKNISVNRITEILIDKLGKDVKPIHGPAVIEPKSTLADRKRAKEVLGWEPRVSFEKGLKTML